MSSTSRAPILWAACLAYGMVILDTTVLNVALPSIAAQTGATPAQQPWIVDSYVLVLTALLLAGGGLIDRFGATRIFRLGIVVFALSSAACAATGSPQLLIAARAVQGTGAAMLIPATLAIVAHTFAEPAARGRAIAIIATVTASPQAFGPTLGGVLVSTLGWRSIFLLNVPVAVAAYLLARRLPPTTAHQRRLDLPGVALVALALGALTYGLITLTQSPKGPLITAAVALVVAVTAGIAFVFVENRSALALLPREVLRAPAVNFYVLTGTFMFMLFYGALYAANLYLQNVQHLGPLQTGLLLLPAGIPVFVLPILVSRLTRGIDPVIVTASGVAVSALGAATALLAGFHITPTVPTIVVSLLLVGIGFGIAAPPHLTLTISNAPAGSTGVVSALANAGRQSGYLFGVALVGTAAINVAGFQTANWLTAAAGVAALAFLLVGRAAIRRTPITRPSQTEQTPPPVSSVHAPTPNLD